MVAVIKIKDYTADAINLPVNVVQSDLQNKYVFVAEKENEKFVVKKKIVKLGQTYDGKVEITDGLKAGDKLISEGYQNIEEGQAVKF